MATSAGGPEGAAVSSMMLFHSPQAVLLHEPVDQHLEICRQPVLQGVSDLQFEACCLVNATRVRFEGGQQAVRVEDFGAKVGYQALNTRSRTSPSGS
jgi:hypothetical protein